MDLWWHIRSAERNVHVAAADAAGFIISAELRENALPPPPPHGLEEVFAKWVNHWEQQVRDGAITNDVRMLALTHFQIDFSREPSRRTELSMVFRYGRYVRHRAVSSVYQELSREKQTTINSRDQGVVFHPFFCNSFGIHLGVVTADGRFVFAVRSRQVAVDPSKIIVGIVEGTDEHDVSEGIPNMHAAAIRGLKEELGVAAEDCSNGQVEIRFVGLTFNAELAEWNLVALARFSETSSITSKKLLELRASDALGNFDAWEFAALHADVDFNPVTVGAFLRCHSPELVNYTYVDALLCLLASFSPDEVRAHCDFPP
mmetsp:Transcript_21530/g.36937  ORF Transcript_21530/g.36937 Transcript_21530/m.36937 type:complete len:316 (-) Transcript_21530:99-1046(-)|eukprot:CAMPEP_0196660276 /NCGR_PEP_ID=MMETSP1086-20130531/38946_1 /TAXON_ID=77921 /ORGANISM="Cyanoptyche  gloeocystis , Strain SAG4.97" /LENGTH=315 /DNA_ID=CAMNT_0041994605 /DNA_START=93 /DNA_END=1040 /DNA_ORIENTATION=-